MKKDAGVFVQRILECKALIEEYTHNKTEANFFSSIQLQDSVVRRIGIIEEAIKNTPDQIREQYSEVPWKNIAGMRDILIHEYFGIDLELIWQVVTRDIPTLKKDMLRMDQELKA